MKLELLKKHYMIVPRFIDIDYAKRLEKEFVVEDSQLKFDGDHQAPNSASCFNFHPTIELLCNKTSIVSELIGETVLPTYSYSRIYRTDSVLKRHTDRPSCEISLTVHLGGDKPWAICIETPEKENKCFSLNPGDAMLYLGCVAPHWRDRFEGDHYVQTFLHYVRSRGLYGRTYFDKIPTEEIEDHKAIREEYKKIMNKLEQKIKT
jgi:hypothetical protein|tara:strand:+ start:73 stop:690 length:618 start_codon:yes stop_codon:yes gene_type:complete